MEKRANSVPARRRITELLDTGSFVEIGGDITARNTDFNLQQIAASTDGVVTGHGLIGGELIFIYSQDAQVLHGTIGEMHAKKILQVYDMALKMGAPVIGLVDCAGIRLQEATDALEAFGSIYRAQTRASGVIPQFTAIFGTCGGGLAVFPRLTDFTFMEHKDGKLFVNAPNVQDNRCETQCDTSSAEHQSKVSGAVDYIGTDTEIFEQIRSLIYMLPSNCKVGVTYDECSDDLNRVCTNLADFYKNPVAVMKNLSDQGFFFEIKKDFAREMIAGFIRLNGITVGVVANGMQAEDERGNSLRFDNVLTVDGCKKAAKFVRFCDAFSIPVVSLTNVTGYEVTVESEKNIPDGVARLIYVFAEASVPKVNVIVGKAYGSAYVAMNSKSIGADLVYAWPNAEIGMMDSHLAAKIMYVGKEQSTIIEKAEEYGKLQTSPLSAARRGHIDAIIEPEDTRKHLINALEMLFTKREKQLDKKHGAI